MIKMLWEDGFGVETGSLGRVMAALHQGIFSEIGGCKSPLLVNDSHPLFIKEEVNSILSTNLGW
jgi:hypothetical protein